MSDKSKIDETDARILKRLLTEARTTFTEMAKECGISVSAVRVRFERLKKEGIITGEIMQINPKVIGYDFVADLGITTNVEDEEEGVEVLKVNRNTAMSCAAPFWKANIGTFVVLHSIEKLARIQEEIEANPHVKHLDTMIWVETTNMDHTENLVIHPTLTFDRQKPRSSEPPAANHACIKIDETDRKIARSLVTDARRPFKKIAEELGISTKNVIQRYSKLRGNLLTLSTITVDLEKLGYSAMANVFVKVSNRSEIPTIYAKIMEIPNVIVTIRLIGQYDLRFMVALKDFEALFKVKEQIRRIQGIEKTEVIIHKPFTKWPLNVFASLP
ncbi:MAG: AsnC family transcriptional regulator [Candidatus Bathyarchaeota archaeon]|nr:AsnC family transcriptional regulator [Candidatus Bathyarchaeota archaeon]